MFYELDKIETLISDISLLIILMQTQYYPDHDNLVFDKVARITRVVRSDSLQSYMRVSIKKSISPDANFIAQD